MSRLEVVYRRFFQFWIISHAQKNIMHRTLPLKKKTFSIFENLLKISGTTTKVLSCLKIPLTSMRFIASCENVVPRFTVGREPGRSGGGREREAGEQGAGSGSRNKKGDSLLFITGYYSVKNTHLANFWNFHWTSTDAWKKISEARKRKFVLGLEKQHYFPWIWKSLQFDGVIGHEIARHVQCLVSCSCWKSPAKKAIQGH